MGSVRVNGSNPSPGCYQSLVPPVFLCRVLVSSKKVQGRGASSTTTAARLCASPSPSSSSSGPEKLSHEDSKASPVLFSVPHYCIHFHPFPLLSLIFCFSYGMHHEDPFKRGIPNWGTFSAPPPGDMSLYQLVNNRSTIMISTETAIR